MSPANSGKKSGGPYRKPRADIYTVLLSLVLIALLLGILCLYLELEMYGWQHKGGPTVLLDRSGSVELAGARELSAEGCEIPTALVRAPCPRFSPVPSFQLTGSQPTNS